MRWVEEFRDPQAIRAAADALAAATTRPWTIMEVCGGQTHTIVRWSLPDLLPPGIEWSFGRLREVVAHARASSTDAAVSLVGVPDDDRELYTMLRGLLEPDGSLVVQCGSPFFAPEAFWTCESTLQAAGWSVTPYHIDVPSFGDWGFQFAQPAPAGTDPRVERPILEVDGGLGLRFLTPDVLRAAQVFPPDVARDRVSVRPSTILDPTIVDATQGAWVGYS